MLKRLAILNVVGLTPALLEHAPHLRKLGAPRPLTPVLPAVTCSVQASMLTGLAPADHGIVGNGWYFRDTAEVRFWLRSGRLIEGETIWQAGKRRDSSFTCANLFWRYAAYGGADLQLIERPIYKADGRKIPDCYSNPPELRDQLTRDLGPFPLFRFWGPMADITSSQWIADAARDTFEKHEPTLTLTYLPHLDYCLQKLGPDDPAIAHEVARVDRVAGQLIDFFQKRDVQVIALSEYGIEPVDRPIFINRILREAGHIAIREEDGLELLDFGASDAFAVADHQVAHVYASDRLAKADGLNQLAQLCRGLPGVAEVQVMDHPRAGDLVLVAEEGAWFTYDYWLDAAKAPDFARTVDIHSKPGYDPRELFCATGKAGILRRLAKKKLGFRQLMDVIPLDASLVKGSHGRVDLAPEHGPLVIAPDAIAGNGGKALPCTAIKELALRAMFG